MLYTNLQLLLFGDVQVTTIDWPGITAFIVQCIALVGAVATAAVTIIKALKKDNKETTGAMASVVTDAIEKSEATRAEKMDEIHAAVNGTQRAMTEELVAAKTENVVLRQKLIEAGVYVETDPE